jgi:hypothetical protein
MSHLKIICHRHKDSIQCQNQLRKRFRHPIGYQARVISGFCLTYHLQPTHRNWLYISGVPVLLIRVAHLHRTSSEGAEFCRRKRHRGARAILTGDSISEACGWKEVFIDPNTRVRLLRLPAMQGKGSWDASRVSSTLGATCVMYTYNSASIHHAADSIRSRNQF